MIYRVFVDWKRKLELCGGVCDMNAVGYVCMYVSHATYEKTFVSSNDIDTRPQRCTVIFQVTVGRAGFSRKPAYAQYRTPRATCSIFACSRELHAAAFSKQAGGTACLFLCEIYPPNAVLFQFGTMTSTCTPSVLR